MTGDIVLYDYWRSTASYRVRIALNLKGLAYRSAPVNLLEGAHKTDAHRERQPQGFVPALDIDGMTLTQSLAVIRYLDSRAPQPPLFPTDPTVRAQAEAVAHAIAMDIHPVCNLSVAKTVMDWVGGDEATRTATRLAWMQTFIGRGLDAVETMLPAVDEGEFAFGDRPSVADLCIVPQLYNARRWSLDPARWPRLTRVETTCFGLEAFRVARPEAVG